MRKTRDGRQPFLLLGEKVRMRADVKYKFQPTLVVHFKMMSGNRVNFRDHLACAVISYLPG